MIGKLVLLLSLIYIQCHSHSENQNNKEELKLIFHKYANNSNLMNSKQLINFMIEFKQIFTNDDQLNSNCFDSKFNQLLNQTKSLNNDTVIDGNKFSKMSTYLVLIIDKCFSVNQFNNSQFNQKNDQNNPSSWDTFVQNIRSISKESMQCFIDIIIN